MTKRSRPPLVGIVLLGAIALGLLALLGNVVVAAYHMVDDQVSYRAQRTTTPQQRFDEFNGHPLLGDIAVPATECELPPFERDAASLQPYYEALVRCLDEAWRPVLAAARVELVTPGIELADDPADTACAAAPGAEDNFTAWYCPVDQKLNLPVSRMTEYDRGRPDGHIATVAHEYGHHVQELSGLLESAYERMNGTGADAGKEVSRRLELQANCFAGLFLSAVAGRGSVTKPMANGAVDEFVFSALASTHGSQTIQAAWAGRGYAKGNTSACNTWAAPASEVAG